MLIEGEVHWPNHRLLPIPSTTSTLVQFSRSRIIEAVTLSRIRRALTWEILSILVSSVRSLQVKLLLPDSFQFVRS